MTPLDERLFALLLYLYPREFRERYRDDLVAFVRSDRRHHRYGRGPLRPLRFWRATLADLLRAAARERFGWAPGRGDAGDRGSLPLVGITLDLRQGWRRLLSTPAATLVAIVTLALGIGVTTAVYALAYGIWLKPLPFHDPDRLVTVFARQSSSGRTSGFSRQEFEAYLDGGGAFEGAAGYRYGASIARINGERVRVAAYPSSPNLFEVLGVTPAIGPGFSRDGAPDEVVLSDRLWRQQFGRDPSVIGRSYDVNGTPHTIVGVMPEGFHFPQFLEADAWLRNTSWFADPKFRFINMVARLRAGVTLADARQRLEAISARVPSPDGATGPRWIAAASPIAQEAESAFARPFGTLIGITAVLLALACTNAVAILLTRASARRGEIAMRIALGATRSRLARELMAEAVLLTIASTAAGIFIALESVPLMRSWLPAATPRLPDVALDGRVLAMTVVVSAVTALACGLVPLLAQRALPTPSAIGADRRVAGDPSKRPLRMIAVVEVAMTVLLIVAATLMLRSFMVLVQRDHGFDPNHLLTLDVSLPFTNDRYEDDTLRAKTFAALLNRVSQVPGIVRAGATTGFPGSALGILGVATLQSPAGTAVAAAIHACSDDYFSTMGTPIESGRGFEPRDASGRTLIVSHTLAMRLWPDAPVAGHTLVLPAHTAAGDASATYEVIGVAGDMRMGGDPTPRLFLPMSRTSTYWVDLVARTSVDPRALTTLVRAAVREIEPDALIENVRGMDRIVSDSVALQRAQTLLAALVAGLAAVLAAAGLYGLLSYTTVRRMRELGVRMALGATPSGIFGGVLLDACALTGIGAAVGVVAAVVLAQVVRQQVFGLGTPHWTAFAAAPALMLAIAVAAVWAPARRAATVDPLSVMRDS